MTRRHISRKVQPLPLLLALAFSSPFVQAQSLTELLAAIPGGTGFAALDMCTRTMQSGDNYYKVRWGYVAPKVSVLPLVWDVDYRPSKKVDVQTVVPFYYNKRTAIYRKGLGCTIVPPGTNESDVRAQAFTPVTQPAPSAQAWPIGEGPVESYLLTSAQQASLKEQADAVFAETSYKASQKQNTMAFLVAKNGHLVYERYGAGYKRAQPQIAWSMTKSVTALLIGSMATNQRLNLDDPVGLPQWSGSAKAAITWKHMLNMAPGLSWNESLGGDAASEGTGATSEMLFSTADQGSFAAAQPLEATPGTVFTYSTGTPNIAMLRIRQLLGGTHQSIYDYYQRNLFLPLGIRDGVIEPDASGTPIGGARAILRPVDWLRLGQLVVQNGQWQGQTIVAPDVMAFLTAPSAAYPGYAGMMWRKDTDNIPADLRAQLPNDLLWFGGHMGQYVVIIPSKQLVVLRIGVSFDRDETTRRVFGAVIHMLDAI